MSSAAPSNEPQSPALTELLARIRELSMRVELLEADGGQRHTELETQLVTALSALELIHDDDPGTRRRLLELRASDGYDQAFTAPNPLVSVVIPTWNRADTLLERAIPSALNQTHANTEVIVVGDSSPPEIGQALAKLSDPRVRFHNLTLRGPYDEDRYRSWLASGTPGLNAGVALASGLWIAPLGDDDQFEPNHVALLLSRARADRLEFVYGRGRVLLPDGRETMLGEFPPRLTQVGLQASIYHAGLRFMELELGHALFGKPNDWGLVHRMMRVGVRMGMVDEATVTYFPSLRAQTPNPDDAPRSRPSEERTSPTAELVRLVSELEQTLGGQRALNVELQRRLEELYGSRSWRLTAPLRRLLERSG
jgi:hypothetical protein